MSARSLRHLLARLRDRFSPSRRRIRFQTAEAERLRIDGFRAIQAVVGKGDVDEVTFTARGTELLLRDGRRFQYDPTDRLQRLYSLPVTGEFERKETEWVRCWVRAGQLCVDAGGSFGWYAVLLGRLVGASGRVHVFEPILRTVEVLESNLARNGCDNVRVFPMALADQPGEMSVFVPDIGVSGSLRLHDYKKGFETFTCKVETLDAVAETQSWNRLDFIKADIEGAEFSLLRGAEKSIARWKPLLLLEIQADSTRRFGHEPSAVFDWLFSRGYVAGYVTEQGILARVKGNEVSLPDYNFIFVPTERMAEFEWKAGS